MLSEAVQDDDKRLEGLGGGGRRAAGGQGSDAGEERYLQRLHVSLLAVIRSSHGQDSTSAPRLQQADVAA